MFADFAAHGRSSLNCRELRWTAPVKLAAVQPSPWLYSGSYRPTQKRKQRQKNKEQHRRKRETYPEIENLPGTAQRIKANKFNGRRQELTEDSKAADTSATSAGLTWEDRRTTTPVQSQRNREGNQSNQPTKKQGEAAGAGQTHKHQHATDQRGKGGEPGGSTRQEERGHTRTRRGTRVP